MLLSISRSTELLWAQRGIRMNPRWLMSEQFKKPAPDILHSSHFDPTNTILTLIPLIGSSVTFFSHHSAATVLEKICLMRGTALSLPSSHSLSLPLLLYVSVAGSFSLLLFLHRRLKVWRYHVKVVALYLH